MSQTTASSTSRFARLDLDAGRSRVQAAQIAADAAASKTALGRVLGQPCQPHSRPAGQACWTLVLSDGGRRSIGLCGHRIRTAGFLGVASTRSVLRPVRGGRS